eukprot:g4968.t1
MARYMTAFFGLPARVAQPVALRDFSEGARGGYEGQLQLLTDDIFNFLLKRKRDRDVLCSVAVTMADLFIVKDGVAWNFVFGQARIFDSVGVYSFARYDPRGFSLMWNGSSGLEADDSSSAALPPLGKEEMSLMLYRSVKVMCHETGHIFGIKHCVYYECLMCGCNHLEEFDKRFFDLCPICLRKLQSSNKFDALERYRAIAKLCEEFDWPECGAWLKSRIEALEVASA